MQVPEEMELRLAFVVRDLGMLVRRSTSQRGFITRASLNHRNSLPLVLLGWGRTHAPS